MTAKKKTGPKKKQVVNTSDTLNTLRTQFVGEACQDKQESTEDRLRRTQRHYSELSDKYYPLREMFFELESLVKLTGVIDEAIFDKVFVKHRVRF